MFSGKRDRSVTKLPFGFRDIFPVEARERKALKDLIRKEFELWGYGEVKTPAIEYTSNISQSAGRDWKDNLLSFFDKDGSLVSLRADMTIPIARLTGMRLKKSQMPARFYYFANSFRQSEVEKGLKRVINQAGLELIGSSSFVSDIEVLTILIDILEKLDLRHYKIGIGHVGVLEGLYRWLDLDEKKTALINKSLISGDFVQARSQITDKARAGLFFEMIRPENDVKHLERLSADINEEGLRKSIRYLKKIFSIMRKLGKAKSLLVDIGKTKEFDYYTGLFFEVFAPQTNEVIGSGGRYDGLIAKFGLDVPATGFAVDIDVLHNSVDPDFYGKHRKGSRSLVVGGINDCEKVFLVVKKLQDKGMSTETYFGEVKDAQALAAKRSCQFLYFLDKASKNIQITDMESGNRDIYNLEDYLKW